MQRSQYVDPEFLDLTNPPISWTQLAGTTDAYYLQGLKAGASWMLGKHSTTELYSGAWLELDRRVGGDSVPLYNIVWLWTPDLPPSHLPNFPDDVCVPLHLACFFN